MFKAAYITELCLAIKVIQKVTQYFTVLLQTKEPSCFHKKGKEKNQQSTSNNYVCVYAHTHILTKLY